jgi:hypothetical protein
VTAAILGQPSTGAARVLPVLLIASVLVAACRPAPQTTPTTAPPRVRITFVPQSDSFAAAARAYDQLWAAEGPRIVEAMERISGLRFVAAHYADTAITANVLERASNSGYRSSPMTLRASYPPDTKKATLIHELGHRLQSHLFRQSEEEHGPLFLWVYDVWVELYGQAFADAQVQIERVRGERYVKAWGEALAYRTPAERAARWRAIVADRAPRGH